MSKIEIYEKIVELLSIKYKIKKEEIKLEAVFMEDIKINSLQLLLFISDIEDSYDVQFDEDELLKMQTVDDFCVLIKNEIDKKAYK